MKLRILWFMVLLIAGGCTSTPNDDGSGNPLVTDRNHPTDWAATHGISAAVEVDSCKVCHGADYLGGTVNVSCMTCHLGGPPFSIHTASWTNTLNDHQTFATLASWTTCANGNCHGADLAGGSSGGASTGPGCLSGCHTTGNNAGQPDAPHGNYDPATTPGNHGLAAKADMVYCRNCHGRPENTFDGGFVTGILADPSGISANCSSSSCHPDAMAHPTNWQGSNDTGGYAASHRNNGVPQAVINNSCALCHKVDGAGVGPMAGAPSCYSADFTNANTSNTNCHANGPGSFHTPSHFSWAGTCANCHTGASIVADVHNSSCGSCHVSVSGGGTLRNGTDGNALGATVAGSCLDCHGGVTKSFIHHDTANAQSGTCTYCHSDPRPTWVATYSVGSPPSPIPTQLFCIKCHIDVSGADYVVNKLSYTPTNVATIPAATSWGVTGDASVTVTSAVHTIPALNAIGNYGACLGCHASGYVSEFAPGNTAPQIQVWHAKPVWNDDPSGTVGVGDDDAGDTLDNTFDVLRSAPGRSYYADGNTPPANVSDPATTPKYNIFSTGTNTGGVTKLRVFGRYTFSGNSNEPYRGTASQSRGKDLYQDYSQNANNPWVSNVWGTRVTIPRIGVINNTEGILTSDPSVPVP